MARLLRSRQSWFRNWLTERNHHSAEVSPTRIRSVGGDAAYFIGHTQRRYSLHYRRRLATLSEGGKGDDDVNPNFDNRFIGLSRVLLRVERQTAVELRNQRRINDELLREIEHELDLGQARLLAKGK